MLAALPWARNGGKAPTEQMYVGVSQKCRVGASPVPRTALAYGAYFISEWGGALFAGLSNRPQSVGGVMLNYSNCRRV